MALCPSRAWTKSGGCVGRAFLSIFVLFLIAAGDRNPPEFGGLSELVGCADSVFVAWKPASGDGIRYRVYVSKTEGDQDFRKPALETGELTANIPSPQGAPCFVIVRAVDAAG